MQKICKRCGTNLPLDKFSVTKRNLDGTPKYRHSWCTPCRTEDNRKRLGQDKAKRATVDVVNRIKECNHCRTLLPFECFSPSVRGSAGLAAYCKSCQKVRYYNKDAAKIATQKYRDRHRFRWRAMHRIHQYNRRALIKATRDGSITDELLDAIYNMPNCYWCGEYTEESARTLEHIVELSNGGQHVASNVTMSCLSCNSSRPNKENTHNADRS